MPSLGTAGGFSPSEDVRSDLTRVNRSATTIPREDVVDFEDKKMREVFFALYGDLPRAGPGNKASTARALELAHPLPSQPRVLDIGCGPGIQTLDLAELADSAQIDAIDTHQPYVDLLNERAQAKGLQQRVRAAVGDMTALPFPAHWFDLLWSEGAAYIMGVENALTAWRPLLTDGGVLAFSELVWVQPERPEPVESFFMEQYPQMGDVEATVALIESSG